MQPADTPPHYRPAPLVRQTKSGAKSACCSIAFTRALSARGALVASPLSATRIRHPPTSAPERSITILVATVVPRNGVDGAGLDASERADFVDALEHAFGLVGRRARRVRHDDLLLRSAARALQHDVGKRPADIDADADHVPHLRRVRKGWLMHLRARDDIGPRRMPGNAERRSFTLHALEPINLFTLTPLIGAFLSFRKY
jgi:hypothetical protein